MSLQEYKQFAMRKRVELDTLTATKSDLEKEQEELEVLLDDLEEGRDLVSQVGIIAQKEVNDVIEELVTKALHAVFGEQFEFQMENEIKRGRPETNFYLIENGKKAYLDDDSCGGGMTDLVALCLRVVLWAIRVPRTAPIIILDEPFKHLDEIRIEQAGLMIKELSRLLSVQFLVITHSEHMKDCADVMYSVEKIGDESYITCVKFEDGFDDEERI